MWVLFALTMVLRSLWVTKGHARAARPGRQAWFFVIAGALAVWFLGSSMYLRFHAIGIGPREIELIFFWPRPPVSIGADDLVDVKLLRTYRTCGHMEVTTRQELFRSVNFKNAKALKRLSKRFHHGFTPTLRIVACETAAGRRGPQTILGRGRGYG